LRLPVVQFDRACVIDDYLSEAIGGDGINKGTL